MKRITLSLLVLALTACAPIAQLLDPEPPEDTMIVCELAREGDLVDLTIEALAAREALRLSIATEGPLQWPEQVSLEGTPAGAVGPLGDFPAGRKVILTLRSPELMTASTNQLEPGTGALLRTTCRARAE